MLLWQVVVGILFSTPKIDAVSGTSARAAVLGFAFQPQHSFITSSLPGYQCQEAAFGIPGPRQDVLCAQCVWGGGLKALLA